MDTLPAPTTIVPGGLLKLSNSVHHESTEAVGHGSGFTWITKQITAHEGVWHETTLNTNVELIFAPSLIVWLGALDNLNDRQAHTWRQTILRGPTTNQGGLGGNDLAAGYLYDHNQHLETIIYVPADSLSWAPHRFYELSIREVFEYRPTPRYGIGLIPSTSEATFTFAPGVHHFRVWTCQRTLAMIPSPWEAQRRMLAVVGPLLDPQPSILMDAPPWSDIARGTLIDLNNSACWVEAGGKRGLRAYVKGSSGIGRDEAQGFELMTQLDVLLPLLHWRARTGSGDADTLIEQLLDAMRVYRIIDPHDYLPNHYPYAPTDTFMDTWYFFENALIKLPWVAHLTHDADLRQVFLTALNGGRALIEHTHFLPPLFADASDWKPRGGLLNVGVSGMYAAGCILAQQMTGDTTYLDQARRALTAIHQLSPYLLTHEPQQLSFAAAAAAYLGEADMASDFVGLSLRMGYWAKDPSVPFYDPRGMFQACASLSYPAYKENVEVMWAWSELLADEAVRAALPVTLLAAFANLQRCHNYAFFDPFLPAAMRRGPCSYVPYEDLPTAEFTRTATLGKELYGAGEVFWSALLFDRPASLLSIPTDVLTFSLDIPCLKLETMHNRPRRWLAYNPRSTPIELACQLPIVLQPKAIQFLEGA
jgi:hypothetical protein